MFRTQTSLHVGSLTQYDKLMKFAWYEVFVYLFEVNTSGCLMLKSSSSAAVHLLHYICYICHGIYGYADQYRLTVLKMALAD